MAPKLKYLKYLGEGEIFRVVLGLLCLHLLRYCGKLAEPKTIIMERPEPLSIRSPNRPTPTSILKRTIQAPGTIRKSKSTTTNTTLKLSSPTRSPTRQWATSSMQSPSKTPRPRPISMVEQTPKP